MFTCDVDLDGFRAAAARTRGAIQIAAELAPKKAAEQAADYAKLVGPFKDRTGQLRAGIVARFLSYQERGATWEVSSPMPYSIYVEKGTKPHDIWPKAAYNLKGPVRNGQTRRASGKGPHEHIVGRGLALRWKVGGQEFFAAMVHHPGSHAYPFMSSAFTMAQRVLDYEIRAVFRELQVLWN